MDMGSSTRLPSAPERDRTSTEAELEPARQVSAANMPRAEGVHFRLLVHVSPRPTIGLKLPRPSRCGLRGALVLSVSRRGRTHSAVE